MNDTNDTSDTNHGSPRIRVIRVVGAWGPVQTSVVWALSNGGLSFRQGLSNVAHT